eukprot:TRINITY_DN16963_c1_g1_i1.p1 TRINITY_DN16963_c1_g1~~TRINITY_DN16963_c1_g1_i1.p1  ORF type:complete len:380 (+),score=92.17 TRINITY_DN16963_c1_g1_i1:155-1141(+)
MWLVQVATVACAAGDVMLGPYADWPPAWLGGGGQPAEGARGEDGITGKPQGGGGQPAEGAPHGADSRGEGRAGGARERSDPPSHCEPCQACTEGGERDGPQQGDGPADSTDFLHKFTQWWDWLKVQSWLPAVVAFFKNLWWLSSYILQHVVMVVFWLLRYLCSSCCCCRRQDRNDANSSPRAAPSHVKVTGQVGTINVYPSSSGAKLKRTPKRRASSVPDKGRAVAAAPAPAQSLPTAAAAVPAPSLSPAFDSIGVSPMRLPSRTSTFDHVRVSPMRLRSSTSPPYDRASRVLYSPAPPTGTPFSHRHLTGLPPLSTRPRPVPPPVLP